MQLVTRYHPVAVLLHWVMALAFFGMLAMGLAMSNLELEKSLQFKMYQWHKSLGVLLLLAFFARIMVRIITRQPPLPKVMKKTERNAAKLGHWLLYAWMIALPLSGWVMVSSSAYGLPTIVFGWFTWPHVPDIAGNKELSELAAELHEWLAYAFILLILGHIGAVIKHRMVEKENLLPRMGIRKKDKNR